MQMREIMTVVERATNREENLKRLLAGNHPLVPDVVYHATFHDFSEFKKGKKLKAYPNFNTPQKHLGHFFTDDPKYAEQYIRGVSDFRPSSNIMPVHISLKNPKIEDISKIDEIETDWTMGQASDYRRKLEQSGHDGIIFQGTAKIGPIREFVVFNANQIKSATGNNGNYDMSKSDITEADQSKQVYRMGLCDTMALALHELTELPLGIWRGFYPDDLGDEGDEAYEDCHAVCVVSFAPLVWIDVDGVHKDKPDNCVFGNAITRLQLVPATENEVREAFTMEEIRDEEIAEAKRFVMVDPDLMDTLSPYLK